MISRENPKLLGEIKRKYSKKRRNMRGFPTYNRVPWNIRFASKARENREPPEEPKVELRNNGEIFEFLAARFRTSLRDIE